MYRWYFQVFRASPVSVLVLAPLDHFDFGRLHAKPRCTFLSRQVRGWNQLEISPGQIAEHLLLTFPDRIRPGIIIVPQSGRFRNMPARELCCMLFDRAASFGVAPCDGASGKRDGLWGGCSGIRCPGR